MTIFSSLYTTRLDRELASDQLTLFTTARRKAAINEGQEQFADLTECLQRSATFYVSGGSSGVGPLSLPQGEYDLNSTSIIPDQDFMRLSREPVIFSYTDASSIVTVLAGDDLPRRDVPWLNRYRPGWQNSTTDSTTGQMPQFYYVRPEGPSLFLGFWPTPSTGPGAFAQVTVPYIARPVPLTSDTNEPFRTSTGYRLDLRVYHQACVHYAAAQLEKLRRDVQASQNQMQQFLSYVSRYLGQIRQKGGTVVTYTRHYFNTRGSALNTDPRR